MTLCYHTSVDSVKKSELPKTALAVKPKPLGLEQLGRSLYKQCFSPVSP